MREKVELHPSAMFGSSSLFTTTTAAEMKPQHAKTIPSSEATLYGLTENAVNPLSHKDTSLLNV